MFEDDDTQLNNPVLVTEAVLDIVARAPDRPDAIYLVTSSVDSWWVSPLLVDGASLIEVADYEWAREVGPRILKSLTGR